MAKKDKVQFPGFTDAIRVFDALKKEKRSEDFKEFLDNRKSKKRGGGAVKETEDKIQGESILHTQKEKETHE